MSNKLTKIGKSTLSLILCLTMLLTTFCFFDIGSVISEAMISKDEHDLSAAGASSNAFSKYSINFPELVYKKAGKTYSEYFLNNDASGNVEGAKSETGNFSFSCSTAKTVSFSAKLYNTDLATQPGVYIKSISMADGRKLTGQKNTNGTNTLSITAGSYSTHIMSIDFSEVAPGTEYIIEWTITYTVTADGNTKYTTYAYTGVKSPALGQAGLVQYQYYKGTYTDSTGQSSYSFIAGADSVDGGNAASAFTNYSGTVSTASKLSPLVTFVGSATNGTNYTIPTGRDVVNSADYFPATNNGGVFRYYDNTSRSKIWNVPVKDAKGNYVEGTQYIVSPEDPVNGIPFVKSSYGNATISIDRSRFTDFNQIPNLSCGYAQFYHHWEGAGNKLYNIRNAVYAGSDAAKYWREYKTENLSTNSKGAKSVSLYCNVDRANEGSGNDNRSYVRGPYPINGAIPTSSGSTYMRFEAMNGYSPGIGFDENCVVIATVQLTYNVVNKSSLRKAYYECMHSGVNNQANASGGTQYWNQYLANLKTMAKKLCVSTNTDDTIPTGYNTVITNAQNELKKKMTADVSAPVYFYVPEAVYLNADKLSFGAQTRSSFQYFIQNDISDPANPTTQNTRDTSGTVYFNYPNATNASIKYRWLTSSGSAMTTTSSTTGTYCNTNSYIDFAGSTFYSTNSSSSNSKSLTLTDGVGSYTISTSSYAPYLSYSDTGCFIEWTVTYTDSVDGYQKTAIAYTYVYKPYVTPVGGATRIKNTAGSSHFGSSLTWIAGLHSVTADTTTAGRYGKFAKASSDFGASGFLTNTSSGYLLGDSATVSTGTQMRLLFGSSTNTSSWFKTNYNNVSPESWLTGNYDSTVPTTSNSTSFRVKSFSYVPMEGGNNSHDYVVVNNQIVKAQANIYIDTSRYSNLNQIPNLGVGFMITDSEDADNGAWYIADFTDKSRGYDDDGGTVRKSKADDLRKKMWETHGKIIARQGPETYSNNMTQGSYKNCGVKYTGTWTAAVAKTTGSKVYQIKSHLVTDDGHSSDVCNAATIIKMNATLQDKSTLRTAVNDAIANFANFGIYDSANMKSYYFEGTEYDSFVSAFKKACQALTKVDGAIDDPTTLANSLNTCTNNLLQLKSLKSNCTAKQYNIGLVRQGDKYLAVDIKSTDENPHVMSYNARDNVTFSPDHFDGYTYSGSVELTSDSLKNGKGIETIYGAYLNCVDNKPNITYLTEGNKKSSEIALSGSTITVKNTSTETTTVPTFEGDTIYYNWVAAVNDPSLTVVSFYVLNPDVLFDNEFDFDEISYSIGGGLSSVFADYSANSLYLVNTKNDSYINDSSSRMKLIPGHTYRVSYNFSSTNGGRSRCTIMPYTAATGGSYTNQIENLASGGTFTVAESNPYIFIRFGIYNPSGVAGTAGGYNGTYSDIYVQDITNIKGVNDDVSEASPHGLYNRTPGSTLDTVANISRTGYKFDGWFDSQDETGNGTGTQYTAESKTPYTNLKLFSKWTVNTITLHYDGNNNTGGTIPADSEFEYGTTQTPAAAPSRAYDVTYNFNGNGSANQTVTATYTFDGWLSSARDIKDTDRYYQPGKEYTDSYGVTEGSVTLTAIWSGGNVTLPNPTRTGYTFGGWYSDSSCSTHVGDAGDSYAPTSNIILYAKWTINQYSVTYDYATNKGTALNPANPKTTYDYNASIDLSPKGVKAGWTFVGWNTDKNAHTGLASVKMPAGGITLYAIYKKDISADFVSGKPATPNSIPYTLWNREESHTFTVPTANSITGWTTKGWSTEKTDTSGAHLISGTTVTLSSSKTYYAIYTQEQTLNYDANGGKNAPGSTSGTAYYNANGATANVKHTVSLTKPTRDGYTFKNWKDKDSTRTYNPGDTFTNYKQSNTLVAQWTANTNTKYVVKVFVMNTSGIYPDTPTYTESLAGTTDTTVTVSSDKYRTQAICGGDVSQFTFDSNNSTIKGTIKGDGTLVLTVKFIRAHHTVIYNSQAHGGNEATATVEVYYQGNVDLRRSATKSGDGWQKLGWTETLNSTTILSSKTMDIKDITLYPVFRKQIVVNFYSGTNKTNDNRTVEFYNNTDNVNLATPIPKTRSGWIACGWTDSTTMPSSSTAYTASGSNVTINVTSKSPVNYYALYKLTLTLIYDANGGSGAPAAEASKALYYCSNGNGMTSVTYTVSKTEPKHSSGYTFGGWSTVKNGSVEYVGGSEITIGEKKTLYAVWIDKATADSNAKKYVETTVTYGYDATTGKALEKKLTEALSGTELTSYNDYIKAVNAYNAAVKNGKSTVTNAENYRKAAANLASYTSKINSIKVVSFLENMTVTYGINGKTETKTGATVQSINLNHYSEGTLNTISSSYKTAKDNTNLTLANQTKFNGYVEAVAKAYTNLDAIGSELKYDVNETSKAVAAQLGKSEDVEAISYVRTDYGPTYYCYTNSKEPKIVINALENPKSGTARIGYPTRFSASSDHGTDSYAVINKTTGNAYSAYTNAGTYAIGNTYSENINGESLSGAAYYSTYSQIQLKPKFTTDKQTVSYTLSATDDALVKENNGLYTGKNYAKTTYLAGTQRTANTGENITIIISYHNSMGVFKATPTQVGSDVALNQYHLFRTAAGASNWELPKSGDTMYSVDHGDYGQCGLGSFTYTFTTEDSNAYTFDFDKCVIGAPKGSTSENVDKTALLKALKDKLIVKDKNGNYDYTNLKAMSAKTFKSCEYQRGSDGKQIPVSGTGVGYWEWTGTWSYNYYPQTGAFTYVHLIDRWGNTFDAIYCVGKMDYLCLKAETNTAGAYDIIESGGSGIASLTLNATGFEILTDENSVMENNVFRTNGNTIRIKTGEANKSYTLNMKDKATNASTATVTSDENGIITLSITDEEYKSGVYTFKLNDTEINLYDKVNNHKYILEVQNAEVEEGETAELVVITTGEVIKARITDAYGNTKTINNYKQNDDGTRTWTFAKNLSAGEYDYDVTVKVGTYTWADGSVAGKIKVNARILDSGRIISAEYDPATNLYKVKVEGRGTKVQFITPDGMTRTYTRHNVTVKSITSYDADGEETNDTSVTLDYEVWMIDAKLASKLKYKVAGKFEAGWNRADDAVTYVVAN